jgi:hypothetical protein
MLCGDNDEERYVCEYPNYDNCHIGGNNPNLYGVSLQYYESRNGLTLLLVLLTFRTDAAHTHSASFESDLP